MTAPGFTPTQLAARAAYLLRGNDLGTMTSAAPKLYPHMWSWDAAFVAVGLAPLSVERAVMELDTLLSAQWKNGMIPHIVFANGVDGYFPGSSRWECGLLHIFEGPSFCGHPDLRFAVPPSTSPVSKDFRPHEYWRGPVWPVMSWLFAWSFARRGWAEQSAILRMEGLRQAADGTFAEYYAPFTGAPLGSMQQSWTAACVLDWLE